MNFYQEITLIPDCNIDLAFIWSRLYINVHLALSENDRAKKGAIGVSFPNYDPRAGLGNKLRLFSESREPLDGLGIAKRSRGLMDFVHIKKVQRVPKGCSYVCFSRERKRSRNQTDETIRHCAKKYAESGVCSYGDAIKNLRALIKYEPVNLPFIKIESLQTKKLHPNAVSAFPLFIKKVESDVSRVDQIFNCYGLSVGKTNSGVPWF